MTRISVVGAAGAVGRTVVKQLLAADETIRVVALLRRYDAEFAGWDRCNVIEGGVFDSGALERTASTSDLMINLAARNPGGLASDWKARNEFFLVNGLGAGLVAAAAERHQMPLVHFSTVSVYETAAYVPGRLMAENEALPACGEKEEEFFERALAFLSGCVGSERESSPGNALLNDFKKFLDTQVWPDSTPVYGLSKLLGETLTLNTCTRICCIRMSDVYGPGHESRGIVINHLTPLAERIPLFVDLGPRTSVYLLYIDDVTQLLRLLTERLQSTEHKLPRVMNFCGERIDSTAMCSHLIRLCSACRLQNAIGFLPRTGPHFDRRYSEDVFDQCFPDFDKTACPVGLRRTYDALVTAPVPCLGVQQGD